MALPLFFELPVRSRAARWMTAVFGVAVSVVAAILLVYSLAYTAQYAGLVDRFIQVLLLGVVPAGALLTFLGWRGTGRKGP